MRALFLPIPFMLLTACSWSPLDDCKQGVFIEARDLEVQVAMTALNLDRGYGVGSVDSDDFWNKKLAYRARCQRVDSEGILTEYNCDILLDGFGEQQNVPISMRVERSLQAKFTERLGDKTEFIERGFAQCEQRNPSYVGQDEWFPGDGRELAQR